MFSLCRASQEHKRLLCTKRYHTEKKAILQMRDSDKSPGQAQASGSQRRCRVGIMYNLKKGLPSALPDAEAEYDDPETIHAIRDAIEEAGFTTELFEATEDLPLQIGRAHV